MAYQLNSTKAEAAKLTDQQWVRFCQQAGTCTLLRNVCQSVSRHTHLPTELVTTLFMVNIKQILSLDDYALMLCRLLWERLNSAAEGQIASPIALSWNERSLAYFSPKWTPFFASRKTKKRSIGFSRLSINVSVSFFANMTQRNVVFQTQRVKETKNAKVQ